MISEPCIETKASGDDLGGAFDGFMRDYEQFKDANERRLGEIERRTTPDVLSVEKLGRLDRALDEHKRRIDDLVLKAQRPTFGRSTPEALPSAHKSAFETYVRQGDAGGLRSLEAKALSSGSDPDGGYLVPAETERTVNRALRNVSPIRDIASVQSVSGSVHKKPFAISGAASGWVAETATRAQTATPALAELAFPTMELYSMPAATQSLLDDAVVNIDAWIADEVRLAFATQESAAFVTGTGVNKPKGFLAYPTIANASWSWGNVGFISSGAAGAFPVASPHDKLIDLTYAVRAPYRANGSFVLSRNTQATIRKMKDADGQYIWQPAAKPGEPPTLLGFPVAESEDMPDVAADAFAIAFGDFARGYLIVDRVGIRVLRDPYSAKPYVLFYTTKRVGGGIQDFDAIKLMKFSA
jgi:HK97 family phage major capsid protein